jgi:hypothetical protein
MKKLNLMKQNYENNLVSKKINEKVNFHLDKNEQVLFF